VPLRSVLLVLLWLRLCRAGLFVSSCENTCGIMYRRIQSTTLHSTPITAGSTAYSVIPAKAGIQANWNGERTWIPACAGMTRCGENGQREPPFSSSLGERKIMKHFVVTSGFLLWLQLCCAGLSDESQTTSGRRNLQQLSGVAFEYRALFDLGTTQRFYFIDALPVAENVWKVGAEH